MSNQARQPTTSTPDLGIAVYALSRAHGVSEEARAALQRAREVFNDARKRGEVSSIDEHRLGLEGETRLCAQLSESTYLGNLLEQVRSVTADQSLVRVTTEPCLKPMPTPAFADIG